MLRKIVFPRLSAAFRYFEAAAAAKNAVELCEAEAADKRTSLRKKIRLREEANALRKRGLELRSQGENRIRAIKKKWF